MYNTVPESYDCIPITSSRNSLISLVSVLHRMMVSMDKIVTPEPRGERKLGQSPVREVLPGLRSWVLIGQERKSGLPGMIVSMDKMVTPEPRGERKV